MHCLPCLECCCPATCEQPRCTVLPAGLCLKLPLSFSRHLHMQLDFAQSESECPMMPQYTATMLKCVADPCSAPCHWVLSFLPPLPPQRAGARSPSASTCLPAQLHPPLPCAGS